MFITYQGSNQKFDPSSRKEAYRFRARRPVNKAALQRKYAPGTFQWRKPAPTASKSPKKLAANRDRSKDDVDDDGWTELPDVVASRRLRESSLSPFRSDPFDTYPIPSQTYFQPLIDFYTTVISPETAPRVYPFSFAMQNEILFEALMAFTLCVMPGLGAWALKARLAHHGSTLVKLNRTLSTAPTDEATSDAVIITVATLVAANASIGLNTELLSHLKGLRKIVDLRGGLDALDSRVKALVQGVETLAHVFPLRQDSPPRHDEADQEDPPYKPFPHDVAKAIKQLPVGLRELAFTWRLSFQFIRLLASKKYESSEENRKLLVNDKFMDILQNFAPIERMIWFNLITYHHDTLAPKNTVNALAQYMLSWEPTPFRAENEWSMWAFQVLISLPEGMIQCPDGQEKLRARLIFNYPSEGRDYSRLLDIAYRFWWDDKWTIRYGTHYLQMLVEYETAHGSKEDSQKGNSDKTDTSTPGSVTLPNRKSPEATSEPLRDP